MKKIIQEFSGKKVTCFFDADSTIVETVVPSAAIVFITDQNIIAAQPAFFNGRKTIVIPAGEAHKQQRTVDDIILQLINCAADRSTFLVGVGGGVITDITGYVAGIYMRGLAFGFIPASLLAMVDAAIGGKNGVDAGVYKNIKGLIRQPEFIYYDYTFLQTLPPGEWSNGFAEIIKHACIKDETLFAFLESHTPEDFMRDKNLLPELVERNVLIKSAVVAMDEFETGERKLLNFGHTFGHAIETCCQIPHGHAVSIGMVIACKISEQLTGMDATITSRIKRLLQRYHLPVDPPVADTQPIWSTLQMDKKRNGNSMSFILLEKIGEAKIVPISMEYLEQLINQNL